MFLSFLGLVPFILIGIIIMNLNDWSKQGTSYKPFDQKNLVWSALTFVVVATIGYFIKYDIIHKLVMILAVIGVKHIIDMIDALSGKKQPEETSKFSASLNGSAKEAKPINVLYYFTAMGVATVASLHNQLNEKTPVWVFIITIPLWTLAGVLCVPGPLKDEKNKWVLLSAFLGLVHSLALVLVV